jgi:hypothetical protein
MKETDDDFDHDAQQAGWFTRRWGDILLSGPRTSLRKLNRSIDEFEARIAQTTRTKWFLNERMVTAAMLRLEIGFFKGAPINVLARLFQVRSKLGYINELDRAQVEAMYARMCLERGATRRGAAVLGPWLKKLDARAVLLPWSMATNIRETHAACVLPPSKASQRTRPRRERKPAGKLKATRRRTRR